MENKSDWIPIAILFAHKDNFAERIYLTPNTYIYNDKSIKINPKPTIWFYRNPLW